MGNFGEGYIVRVNCQLVQGASRSLMLSDAVTRLNQEHLALHHISEGEAPVLPPGDSVRTSTESTGHEQHRALGSSCARASQPCASDIPGIASTRTESNPTGMTVVSMNMKATKVACTHDVGEGAHEQDNPSAMIHLLQRSTFGEPSTQV